MAEKEIRQLNTPAKVEVREDGAVGSIYGYPIVYNKDSEDMGFIERIAPGAAKKALERSNIRALKNHDPSLIFGRQGVNLKFSEDKNGLRYEATPIDTRNYREVAEEVRLGLLTGQSFGFTVLADKWSDLDTDKPKRTITEIGQIYDVGPVTYPAYNDTSVALRSLEDAKKEPEPIDTKIKITFGERVDEFSLNDAEGIEQYFKDIRSEANPTISTSDNADDGPTPDESLDTDKGIMERMNETLNKYSEEK